MADFETLEESLQQSRPLEVYRFILDTDEYRYTTDAVEVTVDSLDYTPESISRNAVSSGSNAKTRALTVTVPAANGFAQLYKDIVPGAKATLFVYRLQRDESPTFDTSTLEFRGQVKDVRFTKNTHEAEITVKSTEDALSATMPSFTYTAQCNLVLYGTPCGKTAADFDYIGNVSVVDGNVVTVDGAGASGFDFSGGWATPTGETDYRMIISQSTDELTLLLPFQISPLSQDVQCFAGCDRLIAGDCATVFDNVNRNGGFPFVPNRNIFERGLDAT